MNKIINKSIKYLTITLGVSIITFIIYNLFLKYFFISPIIFYYFRYLVLVSLLIQILTLLRNMKLKLFKDLKEIFFKIFDIIYWKPLNSIYDLVKATPGIGDLLYFTSKLFLKISAALGKNSTIIFSCFFYLIPNIIISYFCVNIIFFTKEIPNYIFLLLPLSFIILRLINLIMYILHDFAEQNKKALEPYLIITIIDKKTAKYELNLNTVKKISQEKLKLYAERYVTFSHTLIFIDLFLNYRDKVIKPLIRPFLMAIGFVFTLYLTCKLFFFPYTKFMLIICFFIVLILELFNTFYLDKNNFKQICEILKL